MSEPESEVAAQRQVFVSYASQDRQVALVVASALRDAGQNVFFDQFTPIPGESVLHVIEEAVKSSDVILVLLSPNSVKSRWIQHEYSVATRQLRDRAVIVLPILIDKCEIPSAFSGMVYLDLTSDAPGGLQKLVDQLSVVHNIDFSSLDAFGFERLAASLLDRVGFSLEKPPKQQGDPGYDYVATFRSRDPFGLERVETWLIEVKYYRQQRVGVSALQQSIGYLSTARPVRKGLIITNGQLTSVSRSFLEQNVEKLGFEVRVVDRTELTRLLMRYPDLVSANFPEGGSVG